MSAMTAMTTGSAALLERIAEGDRDAWQEICQLHAADIHRIAVRIVGAAAADDACHDVLVHLYRQSRHFHPGRDGDEHAIAWIRRLAINACLNLRRRDHQRRGEAIAPVSTDAIGKDRDQAERVDDESAVLDAVGELPASERQLVIMRFWQGLEHQAIADQLGCSEGAARVRLHRVLKQLRRRLSALGLLAVPSWAFSSTSAATGSGPALPAKVLARALAVPAAAARRRSLGMLSAWGLTGAAAALAALLTVDATAHQGPTAPTASRLMPHAAAAAAASAAPAATTVVSSQQAPLSPAQEWSALVARVAALGATLSEGPPMTVYLGRDDGHNGVTAVGPSRQARRLQITWARHAKSGSWSIADPPLIATSLLEALSPELPLANHRTSKAQWTMLLPGTPERGASERYLCVTSHNTASTQGITLIPYAAVADWFAQQPGMTVCYEVEKYQGLFGNYEETIRTTVDEVMDAPPATMPMGISERDEALGQPHS